MEREPVTDVVVLLPGIMGSVLRRGGEDVWSVSRGALFRSLLRGTGPIDALKLDGDDPDEDELGDGVSADRLIDDVHMIPGLWSIDGYSRLRAHILALPGVVEAENYFELPYDWRRDNRVAARRLERRGRVWLERYRHSAPGRQDARLVLVAHSMGGLVARYFLEVLGGWRDTSHLITLGTPYRGSLNALEFLVSGMRRSVGPVTLFDLSEVVASLTSVYQLLPLFTCWDPGDGQLLSLAEVDDVPNLDARRVAEARAFHDEIEAAVASNSTNDAYADPATGYLVDAIVGITQPTVQSARVDAGDVRFLRSHSGRNRDGDGRVMRESAAPTDRSQLTPLFLNQAHSSLQNDAAATVQIQARLSAPKDALRADVHRYRFGLDIDDVWPAGRAVPVRVTVAEDVPALRASAIDTASHERVVDRMALARCDDGYEGELAPLTGGTYRLVIDGDDVAPVVDTFVVVD